MLNTFDRSVSISTCDELYRLVSCSGFCAYRISSVLGPAEPIPPIPLVRGGPFHAELLNVLGTLLQHGRFAQLSIRVLLQLRNQRVQHIEPVLDVVPSFLLGMDVPRSSLAFTPSLLLVELVANTTAAAAVAVASLNTQHRRVQIQCHRFRRQAGRSHGRGARRRRRER